MTIEHARRWSFYLPVAVNVGCAVLNLSFLIVDLITGQARGAQVAGAVTVVHAIACWLIVASERRLQLKIATAESYLQEQRADTAIKEAMVESIRRHGAVVGFDGPLMAKARPN